VTTAIPLSPLFLYSGILKCQKVIIDLKKQNKKSYLGALPEKIMNPLGDHGVESFETVMPG
jgi:hypothetical protein